MQSKRQHVIYQMTLLPALEELVPSDHPLRRVGEALPDHSTLSRALDRFGDEVFNALFARSIAQCRDAGLIDGSVLHVDATTIRADLDANRVGKPDSPDPDARFAR